MWGQGRKTHCFLARQRIIPTRVGTRISVIFLINIFQDHPHACGDKIYYTIRYISALGSSPRVWGQGFAVYHGQGQFRIIPTRVGTRRYVQPTPANPEDHPHACGDKYAQYSIAALKAGSSPRVWGQAFNDKYFRAIARIIPTRVGTSIGRRCSG